MRSLISDPCERTVRLGSTACKCGTSHERIGPRCTVRRACGACACGGCSSVGAHTPHRSTAARSALQTAVGIRIYRPTQAPPDRRARMPRRYSAHRPLRPAPVRALDSHPPRRFLHVGTDRAHRTEPHCGAPQLRWSRMSQPEVVRVAYWRMCNVPVGMHTRRRAHTRVSLNALTRACICSGACVTVAG